MGAANSNAPAKGGAKAGATTEQPEKERTIMNIIQHSPEVDAAIREWAEQYAAAYARVTAEVRALPEFQEWARGAMAEPTPRGIQWTEDDCVQKWIDFENAVEVPWPAAVTPSWSEEAEIGSSLGGEVTVSFRREFQVPGAKCWAYLTQLITVVVDDSPKFDRNHEGARVGDWFECDNGDIDVTVTDKAEGLDLQAAAALARSLTAACELLEAVEDASKVDRIVSAYSGYPKGTTLGEIIEDRRARRAAE